MTEQKVAELCQQVEKDLARLETELKPTYTGRLCPLKSTSPVGADRSCDGPRCMGFVVTMEAPGKVTGGSCVAQLGFGQFVELNVTLQRTGMALENLAAAQGPRILSPNR